MDTELKLLSTALISVDKSALELEQVRHWISHYRQHQQLPLIPVFRYGRFARYRLKEGSEIVAAAETLQLEALWVLVLPNEGLPFCWPGGFVADTPQTAQASPVATEAQDKLTQAKAFASAQALGLSQKAIARKYQVSRSYVNNLLQLIKMPEAIKTAFMAGRISSSQARILSYEKDPDRLRHLLSWLQRESVSARALERAVYHRSDVSMERVTLTHLARQLSEHWQCPTLMIQSGQGIKVTVRPHVAQLASLLEALRGISEVSDLNWTKKGNSDCATLNFVIPSHNAFSVWIHAMGLSDAWELDVLENRTEGEAVT